MHEAVIKKRHPARSGLAPREATGEDRLFPGAGEVTVASRLAAGRGDSLAFPFIRHLPWWVAYRESLSRLAFPPAPLAAAPAGEFFPDALQNPRFI